MEVITYSLRGSASQPDAYFCDVAATAGRVLAEGARRFGPWLDAFQAHLAAGREGPRTHGECIYELLTLGVLWRVYAGRAASAWAPLGLLTGLTHLRRRTVRLKPGIDRLRGVLGWLFLRPARPCPPPPSLAGLDALLRWLAASDVFEQAARRLRAWRGFMATLPPKDALAVLAGADALANWFEVYSVEALGRYTPHVERFLAEVHPRYRWREDVQLCGRQRVEYHLCMIGTEILNRAYRAAFLAAPRKAVLLPPCMRAQPEGLCQARPTPLGARCAACTPGCRIREITSLGQERGFAAMILPGELAVFSQRSRPSEGNALGVVGVSCVLTNADGGWQAQELGIPAQGVPLDYCGCVWHWHERGLATEVNQRQLLRALGLAGAEEG
ncbi:MAG: DUF116 domain-containing protein [Anaerolineae bacterium]|nr:DUF116 domain-containing protein [Anaerolineae bacterium]